ncbi:YHS domain-containing protein [Schlesneria paludicola]|uniref:YHS domain-containing protein n=1 Tax=Schlesneria paludicola TaxID=360056 RepID=UPI00029B1F37|nr:YHS domain-containing protein [Schlesneria paludicola]
MRRELSFIAICLGGVVAVMTAFAAEAEKETAKPATIQALHDFQVLIGGWRGIGQPKRGSQQGAWQERADALWELKPQSHGIRWNIESGKLWKSALFGFDDAKKQYTLSVTLQDDSTRTYRGKLDEKRLIFESEADENKDIHRVTLTPMNENRVILLMEKRPEPQSFYTRVAEIGYQRDGTRLATAGNSGPECVVTGGLGTIKVSYMGKSYYVCCTGCRDAFNDDPEGVLADYRKRKAEESAKQK